MYRKFRNVTILKDFPPICPYILGFKAGRYANSIDTNITCTYTYIHTCRCIHTYMYIHTYIHAYIHVHTYMYIHIHVHIYTHTYIHNLHVFISKRAAFDDSDSDFYFHHLATRGRLHAELQIARGRNREHVLISSTWPVTSWTSLSKATRCKTIWKKWLIFDFSSQVLWISSLAVPLTRAW